VHICMTRPYLAMYVHFTQIEHIALPLCDHNAEFHIQVFPGEYAFANL
jgi:hypothetical protein